MGSQDLFRRECFATRIAGVGFDPGVCPHVRFQVTGSFKLPAAFSTSTEENRFLLERFLLKLENMIQVSIY